MKREEMTKDGQIYELSADYTNPNPDRREKYDWMKHATWPKGARFVLREMWRDYNGERVPPGTDLAFYHLERLDWKHRALYRVNLSDAAVEPFLALLRPVDKTTLLQRMEAEDVETHHSHVLDVLVTRGVLSVSEVVDIAKSLNEMEHWPSAEES